MGALSRHVEARVVSVGWKRTMVVENGRWVFRSTPWKPHGDNIRNLRTVKRKEADIVGGGGGSGMHPNRARLPQNRSYEVMAEHTYFEYEELQWHRYRSFSAKGETTADVHWPEYTAQAQQRIIERRETYYATFSVNSDSADDVGEYSTELDESTWRTLKVGKRYRLTVGLLSNEVKQVSPVRDGSHR